MVVGLEQLRVAAHRPDYRSEPMLLVDERREANDTPQVAHAAHNALGKPAFVTLVTHATILALAETVRSINAGVGG